MLLKKRYDKTSSANNFLHDEAMFNTKHANCSHRPLGHNDKSMSKHFSENDQTRIPQ